MTRLTFGLAAFFVALISTQAVAQTRVRIQRGQFCSALAPNGWAFTGENAAGSSFGADIMRADGQALASYYVVGVAGEMRSGYYARWYATPDAAAIGALTQLGTQQVDCGPPRTIAGRLRLMACRTPQYVGVALYQAFPMQGNGFVLVMRTAASTPALWRSVGAQASAVSRSVRCTIPLRPSSADWTSPASGSREGKRKAEADSEYSQWLGMENYHDGSTGENYWVSPSADWHQTGPRGPGYYANIGGEMRKLEPGRSD